MNFKMHHKIGAALCGPAAAHSVLDMAREHVFLAIHEAVSHMGWIVYSVCGTVAIVVPLAWFTAKRHTKGKGDDGAN